VIIVEGPDGAGKSTLVHHLAEKYDIPIAAKVVDEDTKPMIDDLKHWTEVNLKKGLQWMIFDRHRLISEPIYGPCMGRKAQPGFDDIHWFTGRMIDFTRIHPFIIYCLPAFEVVKSNLADDPKNIAVSSFIEPIYNSYVAQAAGDIARGQAVLFDYGHDSDYSRIDMLFGQWLRNNRKEILRKCSRVVH
jgi:hypothetical protein